MPVHYDNYPRPQFVRGSWENLNGEWDFAFDNKNRGETEKWFDTFPLDARITVPFTYETKASGIGEEIFHPVVWYSRMLGAAPDGKRAFLHFEGSDYVTKVWINGAFVGTHTGGYTRFSFDVTAYLDDDENMLVVRAKDSDDVQQPRGKQRWKKENFGCWYVQTTGIWKTVWLEYASDTRLESVKLTPSLDPPAVRAEWKTSVRETAAPLVLTAAVSFEGRLVNECSVRVLETRGAFELRLDMFTAFEWGASLWSPEQPHLYDIQFTLTEGGQTQDVADSYFGLRTIRTVDGHVYLNDAPYYQRLILDQGYWPDSHLTPPSEAALVEDIDKIKAMGFNGARKHQKVEDELFYYWCDVKGLLVWSEMPSPYVFGDDMMDNFTREWMEIVKMHYNHPSIVTWTPVNESWGVPQVATNKQQQHFTEAVYYLTKAYDAMRPVIVNDGWEHTVSDILTLHDYEETGEAFFRRYTERKDEILDNLLPHNGSKRALAEGYGYAGQPIIISEYGGAAYSASAQGAAWGYGNGVADEEALLARIQSMTDAILRLPYACGFCYTQVTDVQQEVNGLLDERRAYKADVTRLHALFTAREDV